MAIHQLRWEVAALHEAFGRKRLPPEFEEAIKYFKTSPTYNNYCKRAARSYGLTPRQLCIHVALAVLLTPNSFGNRGTDYLTYSHCLDMIHWRRTLQALAGEEFFWARIA